MARERPSCTNTDADGEVCGRAKSAAVHVGYGEDKHEYEKPGRPNNGRSTLKPRSDKTEAYYRDVRRPEVRAAQGKPCEARLEGCTGIGESYHEPATRGRFGGLQAAVEAGGKMWVCLRCHNWITSHPKEAEALGLVMRNKGENRREPKAGRPYKSRFK